MNGVTPRGWARRARYGRAAPRGGPVQISVVLRITPFAQRRPLDKSSNDMWLAVFVLMRVASDQIGLSALYLTDT